MPATIAIKMLEPAGAKARGYWGLAGSIYAKEPDRRALCFIWGAVFHVDADAHTTVAEVKARVAAAQSVKEQSLKVLLFGKECCAVTHSFRGVQGLGCVM
eukprot:s487_g12.t1